MRNHIAGVLGGLAVCVLHYIYVAAPTQRMMRARLLAAGVKV